jgi:hypothetical protein
MLAALAGLVWPLVAHGEEPGLVRRVVAEFDFEERSRGNYETMPRHWFRVQGAGFPDYTSMGQDRTVAAGGQESFRLTLDGGSAAAVLEAGVIPTVPGGRYHLSLMVRTQKMVHSRVRVVGVMLDQQGRFLESTLTTSSLIHSNDRWTPLDLAMPTAPPSAAWLIVRLELLQPDLYRQRILGSHELFDQDIRAAAWFDNLTVYQLPHIEITTQSPLNVVRKPQTPALAVSVLDLTGQTLSATVTVRDHHGKIIDIAQRQIVGQTGGPWIVRPNLPALGWYSGELEVKSVSGVVGRSEVRFVWLGPTIVRTQQDMQRFLLVAEDLTPAEKQHLPAMLATLGTASVQLGLWNAHMDRQALSQSVNTTDPLITQLLLAGLDVGLTITAVPRDLATAAGCDTDKPLDLFSRDPKLWVNHLQALLALYGQGVSRWQIGSTGSTEAFHRRDLDTIVPQLRSELGRYVARPILMVPWSARHDLAPIPPAIDGLMMTVPTSVRTSSLADYTNSWPRDARIAALHLRTLNPERFNHEDRGSDLASRLIESFRLGLPQLAIDKPWAPRGQHLDPDPILPVWDHVTHQLAGHQFVGSMPLGPDVTALLLDGQAGGVMVVWSNGDHQATADIDLYLGPSPVAFDAWGNPKPIQRVGDKQQITVGQSPLFIDGIDMRLARLRAGFRLEPDFVISAHARHEHTLRIDNPFPRTIAGRLHFISPARWDIQPRIQNFSIPAGQSLRLPLTFTFPISEIAGEKRLTARVEIEADESYELELAAPITLGLKHVKLDPSVIVERGPTGTIDVVVTATVINHGETDESFYAFAVAGDLPRQERIVAPLPAGQTMVKRFRFNDAARLLKGQDIRVGLRQTDGPAVLNHLVTVP